MWTLLGLVALGVAAFVWVHGTARSGTDGQDTSTVNAPVSEAQAPAPSSKDLTPTLAYTLTRWDMFVNHTIATLHNRLIHVLMVLGTIFIEFAALGSLSHASPGAMVVVALFVLVVMSCVLGGAVALVCLITAFMFKHRGVVGEHELQITERGLIERTEFNETLTNGPPFAGFAPLPSSCRYMSVTSFFTPFRKGAFPHTKSRSSRPG